MEQELSEGQAREKLVQVVGGLDDIPTWAQRGEGFWYFTFDVNNQEVPSGSPSWLVLDNGAYASVGTWERLGEVLDRLQAT